MKKACYLATLLLAQGVFSFLPSRAFRSVGNVESHGQTALFISSWGTKGSPASRAGDIENKNPIDNIQSYLKAPGPVEARSNIDDTVLVSGLVRSKERTDQFVFDLLNHEESAFEFEKIIAFVDDVSFAKKRLLSRSARYTGLLDKLDFVQASAPGELPTMEQLGGVKSWVVYLEDGDIVSNIKNAASLAQEAATVENLAILAANAANLDVDACQSAVDSLRKSGIKYTLVAVGKLEDHSEGKHPYEFKEFGTSEGCLPEEAVFSRDEAMRMITECLQLEVGIDKALSVSEVYDANATEAKLIKGLREAGYARPQEIDHMLRDGPKKYKEAIDIFKEKNPDHAKGYYTTDAWWEDEKFQKSVRKSSLRLEEEKQKVKDDRTEEIEKIAKEWAKREYFRQSMAGTVDEDMSEESFTESVWERAMFEGDLVYRQMKGEVTNPDAELEDFKARQERKKRAMLKRAKDEMKELLEEENLGGDDLNEKLDNIDPDADNTQKS
eukprot:scaffold15514_cov129-Cylindrotheca_fusiformis.AAC.13